MVKNSAERCKQDSKEEGKKNRQGDNIYSETQEGLFGVSTW